MSKYKYKATFPIEATKVPFGRKEAFASDGSSVFERMIANSDLEELKGLLPSEEEMEENEDTFSFIAYNVAVANLINRNDDGVMTDTASLLAKTFKGTPVNVEHQGSWIIGHHINHGFSSFGENKLIEQEKLGDYGNNPFNIAVAAALYRDVDKYMVEDIEDSCNPKSYMYKKISGSWEIKFNEYIIALGSKKLSEAEIISDDKQVEEFSKYLRAYGGSGHTDDGTEVYRIITGSPRAKGAGLTYSPAAPVQGVTTASEDSLKENVKKVLISLYKGGELELFKKKEEPSENEELAAASTKELQKTEKEQENQQAIEKDSVKENKTIKTIMDIKNIDDLEKNWDEVIASEKPVDLIKRLFQEGLKEKADELAKVQSDKELRDQALANNTKALEQAQTDLSEARKDIKELKDAMASQEKQVKFNERMASILEEYNLDDKAKVTVTKAIKDLNDEGYASWKEDFDSLFASLKKEEDQEEGNKEDEGSNEQAATASLEKTDKPNGSEVPNSQTAEENSREKWEELKKAFSLKK